MSLQEQILQRRFNVNIFDHATLSTFDIAINFSTVLSDDQFIEMLISSSLLPRFKPNSLYRAELVGQANSEALSWQKTYEIFSIESGQLQGGKLRNIVKINDLISASTWREGNYPKRIIVIGNAASEACTLICNLTMRNCIVYDVAQGTLLHGIKAFKTYIEEQLTPYPTEPLLMLVKLVNYITNIRATHDAEWLYSLTRVGLKFKTVADIRALFDLLSTGDCYDFGENVASVQRSLMNAGYIVLAPELTIPEHGCLSSVSVSIQDIMEHAQNCDYAYKMMSNSIWQPDAGSACSLCPCIYRDIFSFFFRTNCLVNVNHTQRSAAMLMYANWPMLDCKPVNASSVSVVTGLTSTIFSTTRGQIDCMTDNSEFKLIRVNKTVAILVQRVEYSEFPGQESYHLVDYILSNECSLTSLDQLFCEYAIEVEAGCGILLGYDLSQRCNMLSTRTVAIAMSHYAGVTTRNRHCNTTTDGIGSEVNSAYLQTTNCVGLSRDPARGSIFLS